MKAREVTGLVLVAMTLLSSPSLAGECTIINHGTTVPSTIQLTATADAQTVTESGPFGIASASLDQIQEGLERVGFADSDAHSGSLCSPGTNSSLELEVDAPTQFFNVHDSISSQASYQILVLPTASNIGTTEVPITVTASFEAQASAAAGQNTALVTSIDASSGLVVSSGTTSYLKVGSQKALCTSLGLVACSLIGEAPCVGEDCSVDSSVSGSWEFSLPMNLLTDVLLSSVVEGTVTYFGGVTGDSASLFAQSIVDPVFQIADQLIPGTDTNYRDAFNLEASVGAILSSPPTSQPVPEPSPTLMLGVSLSLFYLSQRWVDRSRLPDKERDGVS